MGSAFGALSIGKAFAAVEKRVDDPRGVVSTGITPLDSQLHRGGLSPSTFCVLAGRTHTRKTTVALNIMARMLEAGVPVGFIALDESQVSYVIKLMSAHSGWSIENIEDQWHEAGVKEIRQHVEDRWKFSISTGYRPGPDDLSRFCEEFEMYNDVPPRVIFVDYISLMDRDKYAGAEVQRVQRLVEALQVWTNQHEVATIALHQVGRMDEGSGKRYHGDTPLFLESLKYGGEEIADVVLGTFRPALDPVGNMTWDQAQAFDKDMTMEKWQFHQDRVFDSQDKTYLQLLKNRPGVHLDHEGTVLHSAGESMKMRHALERETT